MKRDLPTIAAQIAIYLVWIGIVVWGLHGMHGPDPEDARVHDAAEEIRDAIVDRTEIRGERE